MKLQTRLTLAFLLWSCIVSSQNPDKSYFDRIVLGQSLTIIPNDFDGPGNRLHLEYTWNTNLSINLTNHWRVGMQYLAIFTREKNQNQQNFNIFGINTQYNLLPVFVNHGRVYIEVNANKGNYCTCSPDPTYRKDGLYYLGYGMGLDIPIFKWLHLDLAFLNYNILNKFPEKYNYTQYIVGIDIPFRLKK